MKLDCICLVYWLLSFLNDLLVVPFAYITLSDQFQSADGITCWRKSLKTIINYTCCC